jgi:glycosyltransferase involved in cell wall biosynthesis
MIMVFFLLFVTSEIMKIIYVIGSLEIGGAEKTLYRFLVESDMDKNDVLIICLTAYGEMGHQLLKQGWNVVNVMINKKNFLYSFYKIFNLINNFKPDIVHTWMYHSDFIGGIIAKIAGVKNVIWCIRTTNLAADAKLTRFIRRTNALLSYIIPSRIVCVSESAKSKHTSLGYKSKNMIVIPNGYSADAFINVNANFRSLFRSNFNIANELVIGSVGRFNFVKGQDIFVKSAIQVLERYPNIKFLLVGRDNNWQNRTLNTLIQNSGFTDSFILLDERDDVPQCLSVMDIYCLPSRTEAFPNALVEAMLSGLPCVATDVGDTKIIANNLCTIVPSENSDALANALINMIEMPESQRKLLGEKGKEHIQKEYSIDKMVRRYEDIYSELLWVEK